LDDLVANGTLPGAVADFLAACVRTRVSILVSGGTGSGETTTLGALSGAIPSGERIVTVEDAAELRLRQPHVVRLEARPANVEGRGEVTIRALVRNALRIRPDRIIVGEVRGGEALDMLSALTTGHEGSLTTVHASSAAEAPPASSRSWPGRSCWPTAARGGSQRRCGWRSTHSRWRAGRAAIQRAPSAAGCSPPARRSQARSGGSCSVRSPA